MYYVLANCFIVVMLVYMIFLLVFYSKMMDMESISSYECGFDPNSLTRMVFSYRFFLISILFIIFDVEISLMLPIPFLMMSEFSFFFFFFFCLILLFGLLYEYSCGSLDWLE